jgi:hypothetical protein
MAEKNIRVNMFRVVGDLCPFVQVDYLDKWAEEHTGLMMLDSGSTVNVLSRHMADQVSELCKIHDETTDVLTVTNDLVTTDTIRFSFVFGGIQYSEKFCICDEYQCENVDDLPIVGILGNEFMQKHSLVIDYSEYTLRSSTATPANLTISDCDFFFPMEIGLHYYGVPVLSIQQDGQDIVTLADSGSADNILSEMVIRKHNIPCIIQCEDGHVHGISGSVKAKDAKVSFNLLTSRKDEPETIPYEDHFMVSPLSLSIVNNSLNEENEKLPPIEGILGSPFMAKEGWILDFGAKIIYKLKDNPPYAKAV